jgi:dienelactone hydrolase
LREKYSNSIDGYWEGVAVAQGASLEVRLRFTTLPSGIHATIDFPTWNSIDYPLSNVRYEHPLIHFEIAGAKGSDAFDGQVTQESITGQLSLWGRTAQVRMRRISLRRRYRQEEVTFGVTDIALAGTLLLPNRNGPYPAVVLIAGSGPETRDNSRGMADLFVRRGIAALIYDKRGTGSSTGNWQAATFEDLAQDAIAAVGYLKSRTDINPAQIGLHGTSQGGWIAHLASAYLPEVAFVITISVPAVTPAQQVLFELTTRLRQKGFSENEILHTTILKKKFDEYARTGENRHELENELESIKQERWFGALEALPSPLPSFHSLAGWRSVMDFDPLPYIRQVKCPLLAIFGERDTIVNPQESVDILQGLGADREITVQVFDKANHGLMVFPEPDEPFRWFGFAEHYLDTVMSWVDRVLDT